MDERSIMRPNHCSSLTARYPAMQSLARMPGVGRQRLEPASIREAAIDPKPPSASGRFRASNLHAYSAESVVVTLFTLFPTARPMGGSLIC